MGKERLGTFSDLLGYLHRSWHVGLVVCCFGWFLVGGPRAQSLGSHAKNWTVSRRNPGSHPMVKGDDWHAILVDVRVFGCFSIFIFEYCLGVNILSNSALKSHWS